MEIDELKTKCGRCGHEWLRRTDHPKWCPDCNSPYWDKPRVRKKGTSKKSKKEVRDTKYEQVFED